MSVADKTGKKSGGLGETVSVIVQALLLALVIRTFLFQPFSIPSGSMRPTLLEGDYLFVTKWAYGYSRHSLPFSPPLFDGRIWGGAPERGDVAVFKYPPNPSQDYIKRVIGLPGDRIVGIVQPGAGITIYPIQSPSLTAFDDQPERWIDVRWDIAEDDRERFPARISVTAINAPGSLAEIAQVIAANDANIHTLNMVRPAPDFTEMVIDLEVRDLKHLNRLISQLKENAAVSEAKRVNG